MTWEPDYCSDTDLLEYMQVESDGDDATWAALAVSGASRAIDLACHRQFGLDDAPTTRLYKSKPCSVNTRIVKVDDIMDTDGLTVVTNDSDLTAITHTLTPVNNAVKGKPFTILRLPQHMPTVDFEDVKVTARFGWTAVPTTIKNAALLQASRIFKRREAPFGIVGAPGADGETRLLARVDPDVAVLIQKYVRWWA